MTFSNMFNHLLHIHQIYMHFQILNLRSFNQRCVAFFVTACAPLHAWICTCILPICVGSNLVHLWLGPLKELIQIGHI